MKKAIGSILLLLLAGAFVAMSYSFGRHAQRLGVLGGGGSSDIDKAVGLIPTLFGVGLVVLALLTAAAALFFVYAAIRLWLALRWR